MISWILKCGSQISEVLLGNYSNTNGSVIAIYLALSTGSVRGGNSTKTVNKSASFQ